VEQKRRIIPPVYLLLTLVVMAGFHFLLPITRFNSAPLLYAGIALAVLGVSTTGAAAGAFRKAGTPIVPFEKSTLLITGGFYRFTRNPMYLGLIAFLTGAGLLFGSAGSLIPIPLFAWIMDAGFVRGEERFLQDIFGDEYLAYKRKVRRWL